MINNIFIKNNKASQIAIIGGLVITLIILGVLISIIPDIKDKADNIGKITCGSSDMYGGICVNKLESCTNYGAGSKEQDRYKDACLIEGNESSKNLKCCVPSRDPLDSVYFELAKDGLIVKNGLTLNIDEYPEGVSFKLYFPKFFQCDMLHFYLSGNCSNTVDRNCKSTDGDYFIFPNDNCKAGTSKILSLNSGTCKLVAECYPENYNTPAFSHEINFIVDSN